MNECGDECHRVGKYCLFVFFTEFEDSNQKCRIPSALPFKLTAEKAAGKVFFEKTLNPVTVYTECIHEHATL